MKLKSKAKSTNLSQFRHSFNQSELISMKSLMFRQNEAVMRLTDDLEQSQKREGSLQVLGPDDLLVAGDDGGDGVIMMVQMNTITMVVMLLMVNMIMIVC